jgi:hypothetical protein
MDWRTQPPVATSMDRNSNETDARPYGPTGQCKGQGYALRQLAPRHSTGQDPDVLGHPVEVSLRLWALGPLRGLLLRLPVPIAARHPQRR